MRFLLVDAANDEIINDFGNGTTFSLADLPEFNIVAEPETEGVQNVVFELNGSEISVDNTAPYSLGGDNAGDFQALALEPGEYTLVATPFVLSANGDTVAQTPFDVTFSIVDVLNTESELNVEAQAEAQDVTFSIVDEPNTESELNIEAEAQVEAEAQAEAEAAVAEGIAAGAVAAGAGAAAFGNNALAETTTSGSISLDTRLPAPNLSITGSETSAALLSDGDLLSAAPDIEPSTDVSVISAEAEAEAAVESEVEVEITNGAASATGGSAASAAAVGTNILLFEDGSSRPAAADTETATDSTTSTSTSVSPVLLAFASEESDGTGGTSTDETAIPTVLVDESVGESYETATVAQVAKDKDKKDKFKKYQDKTLPVLVLDTEAEVEALAQAEAEAEAEAVTHSLTAAVVTAPGAAAAAVSGGTAVAVAGEFAVANAGSSVATSTSTSAVTEADFNLSSLENPIVSEEDPIVSEFFDDEQVNSDPGLSESVVDIEGVAAESSAEKGKDKKDKDKKDKDNNIFGQGLFEAEAEVVAGVEVEAEAGNNSAAVASIANGGGGAAGLAATSQISSSSTASTSTEFDRGEQIRDNDVVDRDRNRFEGSVDFADNSIAEVETEAQAQASIGEDNIPLTSATANNFTLGDATAESTTTLEGSSSSIVGGETLGVTSIPGDTSSKDRSKDKDKNKNKDKNKFGATSGDGDVVGVPDNLEIEIESEVNADAEAEISFNAAAAGASAVAIQAENGFLPTPAEGTTATSSSTSVFDNGENRFDDKNAPGAAAGERGQILVPNVDPADLVLEIETEAKAEAEVGFNAGAAAAAASGTGREGLFADTEIITTPFAAAAASGVAPVVEFEIFAPPEGEAGEVFARARAFDPEGGPVSIAVAVAGVPTESGFDNEEEANLEGLGEAIVEVSVFTDPADALNITPLPDNESLASASASEASAAEAEAGYGVAAAAAGAGGVGLFSDASAKSSTSTLPIILADSGETILGTSDTDELLGTDRGDFIASLEGSDKLTGNGGNDLFVYDRLEDGLDTITDFEVGSDKIILTNLLARFDIISADPIADEFVRVSETKKGSLVAVDPDGSGESQAQSLVLVENVSVDELSNLANFDF